MKLNKNNNKCAHASWRKTHKKHEIEQKKGGNFAIDLRLLKAMAVSASDQIAKKGEDESERDFCQ